jgi:hypothetical protein
MVMKVGEGIILNLRILKLFSAFSELFTVVEICMMYSKNLYANHKTKQKGKNRNNARILLSLDYDLVIYLY